MKAPPKHIRFKTPGYRRWLPGVVTFYVEKSDTYFARVVKGGPKIHVGKVYPVSQYKRRRVKA